MQTARTCAAIENSSMNCQKTHQLDEYLPVRMPQEEESNTQIEAEVTAMFMAMGAVPMKK